MAELNLSAAGAATATADTTNPDVDAAVTELTGALQAEGKVIGDIVAKYGNSQDPRIQALVQQLQGVKDGLDRAAPPPQQPAVDTSAGAAVDGKSAVAGAVSDQAAAGAVKTETGALAVAANDQGTLAVAGADGQSAGAAVTTAADDKQALINKVLAEAGRTPATGGRQPG